MGKRVVTGNTKLIEYGVQTENSDMRAHVSITANRVYVYRTKDALPLLENPKYRSVPVYTEGILTARGVLVPVDDLRVVPVTIPWKVNISSEDNPTEKGDEAVRLVAALMREGWFPFPADPRVVADATMQFEGMDIIVSASMRVQVKCDFRAGTPGTGNLFLQTHECNPFGYH